MRPPFLARLAGILTAIGVLWAVAVAVPAPSAPAARTAPAGLPRFHEVAARAGLDFVHGAFRWGVSPDPVAMMGGGLCWLDADGDGWLDLYAVNSWAEREAARWKDTAGLPRAALFRNVGGTFTDVSRGSGADLAIRGNGCVAADLDLNGTTDLYVTAAGSSALLWNRGDGTFVEGARAAGATAYGWHAAAAVGDVNADGWPDLFVAGYTDLNAPVPGSERGFPGTHRGVPDRLFLSNGRDLAGRVTFREMGEAAGLESGADPEHGLGAAFSDLDRDGDLDLYVANDTDPNRLYENVPLAGGPAGDPAGLGFRLVEAGEAAGAADPNAGMGVAAGDYDGDARPDLFVTNAHGQLHGAYRSAGARGGPAFGDARAVFDLPGDYTGWGASWADLDLDTDLDLLLVNGHVPVQGRATDGQPVEVLANLAAQGRPGALEDAGTQTGLRGIGPLLARGSAVADYDNDGDLDVAVGTVGGALRLLENTASTGNWLEVRLGRFEAGVVVSIALPDGRVLVRETMAGSSYLSSEDPRCHFGLGGLASVPEVRIRWPSGLERVLRDVPANQILEVPGLP